MGELSIDLEWGASWQQDDKYYCTLFIMRDYMNTKGLDDYLKATFGNDFGGWRYDRQRHGVEVWFKNKEDMLTFKLITATKSVTP
jgi:hypothetical protein